MAKYERRFPGAADQAIAQWHDREEWQVVAMLQSRVEDRDFRNHILNQMEKGAVYQTSSAIYRLKRGGER